MSSRLSVTSPRCVLVVIGTELTKFKCDANELNLSRVPFKVRRQVRSLVRPNRWITIISVASWPGTLTCAIEQDNGECVPSSESVSVIVMDAGRPLPLLDDEVKQVVFTPRADDLPCLYLTETV